MARFDFNPLQTVMPTGAPTPGQNIRASSAAFGGQEGAAMSQLGDQLERTSDVANRHALAYAELNNETYAKQADTALQTRLRQMGYGDPADKTKPGYFATAGQVAFDGAKPTIEDAQKAYDEVANGLPNEAARKMFERSGQSRVASFSESVASHAAQGRKEWMIGASQARQASAKASAADYYNDPAKINLNIAVAESEVLSQGEILGWPEEKVRQEMRETRSQTHVAVIDRMMLDDPLGAQKYAIDHIDEISGQAHAAVEKALKSSVTPVLTANIWKSTVQGAPAPAANLVDIVAQAESGGRDRGKDGSVITSPKGAKGIMQVMDGTNAAPGFGIQPAANDSLEERARVGRDYLQAMLGRYGNQTVALAAYNWGPGSVDALLTKMGSAPGKSGAIDEEAFLARTPAETRAYVAGINAKAPQQPGRPPQTDDVEKMAPGWIATVRQRAEQAFGSTNPGAVEQAVNGAESYVAEIKRGQTAVKQGARDTLMTSVMGLTAAPGGGFVANPAAQRPTSLEALLASPEARVAWSKVDATEAVSIMAQIKQNAAGEDPPANAASMGKYYELTGLAARDPEAFGQVNLADPKLINALPRQLVKELMGVQRSMQTSQAKAEIQGAKIQHALAVSAPMLKASGIYYTVAPSTKGFDQTKAATYDQFVGRLQENLTRYFEANKKNPNDDEVRKMAGALVTEGSVKGTGWFGSNVGADKKKVFELGDREAFVVPDLERPKIIADYRAVYRRDPTPAEIDDLYKSHVLRGGGK